jgi:hypothetical protein
MTSCKLRIATAIDPRAIDVVTAEVHQATGLQVKPVLQEIDRRELIVELTLNSIGTNSPRELAHRVKTSSPNLEVLGSWPEIEAPVIYPPPRLDQLFLRGDVSAPPVARRAFDDAVPTAGWQPKAGADHSHWLLAVPVLGADGRMVAALARRDGHYHRFSARDAAALRDTLAA